MATIPMTATPGSKYTRLQRRWLATHMLVGFLVPRRFQIQPVRRGFSAGATCEVYEPQKPFRKVILMVYGFTIAGEKENRLVRFAQSFAAEGFRVVVPVLPGLTSINLEQGDLDILVNVMNDLVHESTCPIGVVGFCVGGGLALVAASQPGLEACIDPILLIGPPYSFAEVWAELWRRDIASPETDREWNDFIWQQLIMAYRSHATLKLGPTELDELSHFLEVYCFESSLSVKQEVYERLVKPHGFLDPRAVPIDMSELERLSPCQKLSGLPARVLIIHDPQDVMVPPDQSMKMLAELEQRSLPNRQRLLVSSMFSHVSFHSVINLSDLMAMLDIFGELFID